PRPQPDVARVAARPDGSSASVILRGKGARHIHGAASNGKIVTNLARPDPNANYFSTVPDLTLDGAAARMSGAPTAKSRDGVPGHCGRDAVPGLSGILRFSHAPSLRRARPGPGSRARAS